MPLSSFSTAVTVFLTTWLSGPLIYSLDKLAAMEDERWIFVAGVIVLPCFGLMTYVFARKTQAMAESDQPLFYVFSIFAFTSAVDLFIGLELDGYVKGFMEFYLREGEPYLRSAYGSTINWWDGTGQYSMYIIMIALIAYGRDYRMVGLYWVGSIGNSMIVFMPGNVIGNAGLKWSYMLNIPYVFVPFYCGVKFILEGMKVRHKNQSTRSHSITDSIIKKMFILWFICAIFVAGFRMIAANGCKTPIAVDYVKNIEPYLTDPGQYGKTGSFIYFYYFIPFYVAAICSLLYPNQHWIRDWSLIHAGASSQAQVAYIGSSFHWRTEATHQAPKDPFGLTMFLIINVSLWVVPHLFAVYSNWDGLTVFWKEEIVPRLKSLKGGSTLVNMDGVDGDVSPSRIPTRRQGPVTRQQQKKLK